MPTDKITSYEGVAALQNSRLHAGDIYGNVTNNFSSEAVPKTDHGSSTSSSSHKTALAPSGSLVHKQLCKAVRDGQHKSRLNYLVSQGADVDAKDNSGLTALYYAAFRGDTENVRFLLDRGVDINTQHAVLGTPILTAALRGYAEIVDLMLEHKADISSSVMGLGTVLHCACSGGNINVVRALLSRQPLGGDHVVCLEAMSTMADASMDSRRLRKLLASECLMTGLMVKCTPVLLAAERCHFEILELFSKSANVVEFSQHGSQGSDMHHSLDDTWDFAKEAKVKVMQHLPVQATLSHNSIQSRSAMSYASKASTSSAWSFLGYPRPASRIALGSTLLMWAAASLKIELIEYLLEAGASVTATDRFGRTAIHYAASPFENAIFKDVGLCIQKLANAGADVTAADFGTATPTIETPLMLTAHISHAALDPRTSFKWGSDIHSRCLAAVLDRIASADARQAASREALLSLVSYYMYPPESIELLCTNIAMPEPDTAETVTARQCITTALHRAIRGDASNAVILVLLDHGADPNDRSFTRSSPLRSAMLTRDAALVSVLLDYGADPNKLEFWSDSDVTTPYQLAKHIKRRDLIQLFARAESQQMKRKFMADERDDVATSQHMGQTVDALNSPEYREDDEREANATPEPSSRSWFASLPAFSLPQFRKDNESK